MESLNLDKKTFSKHNDTMVVVISPKYKEELFHYGNPQPVVRSRSHLFVFVRTSGITGAKSKTYDFINNMMNST